MTDNLVKAYHEKIHEKENKDKENSQKMSNKTVSTLGKTDTIAGLKKNKTSEGGFQRQVVTQNY
jgi:hypothetical protein